MKLELVVSDKITHLSKQDSSRTLCGKKITPNWRKTDQSEKANCGGCLIVKERKEGRSRRERLLKDPLHGKIGRTQDVWPDNAIHKLRNEYEYLGDGGFRHRRAPDNGHV
jgi:hypothetical protein